MKLNNQETEILIKKITADQLINLTEMRVFMNWLTDSDNFSACPAKLKERMPHLDLKNIRRAIRGLVTKGYLFEDGWGYTNGTRFKKYLVERVSRDSTKESPMLLSNESKESLERPIPTKYIPTNKPPNPEALASGQVGVKENSSFKDKESNSIPPYRVKTSPWYQHYLKSSIIEQKFNSFPESLKQSAYAITDKDCFVSYVNENTPRSFKYVDPLAFMMAEAGCNVDRI